MSNGPLQPVPANSVPAGGMAGHELDAADRHRAEHYTLLAVLLKSSPDEQTLQLLAQVSGDGSALGRAHSALAQAASTASTKALEREYFRLFIGVGRGEIMPYGSFYLTGFLQEKPLARLRGDLAELGVERAPDLIEFEDHMAVLCEIMAGLIEGRFHASQGADRRFFQTHVEPWAARFFADVEAAAGSDFYKHVGRVGREFLAVEAEIVSLAA